MVAELLERGDLGSDRNVVSENLDFVGLALDGETAGAGSLESDEEDEVSRVGKALRQVMKDAASSDHAARRNNDRRHSGLVDLLGFFGRRSECEARPCQWRAALPDHVAGFVAVFFFVLQKNFDSTDRHRAVTEDRKARDLS